MSDASIDELPRPHHDGAAAHLPGLRLPAIELPSTQGGQVALSQLVARTVAFVHPSIGGIDDTLLDEWTAVPGARGCTPEACRFRDRLSSFRAADVDVFGLSGQPAAQQRDAAKRLRLPYPLLSDEHLELAASLRPVRAPLAPSFGLSTVSREPESPCSARAPLRVL